MFVIRIENVYYCRRVSGYLFKFISGQLLCRAKDLVQNSCSYRYYFNNITKNVCHKFKYMNQRYLKNALHIAYCSTINSAADIQFYSNRKGP